MLYPLLTFFGLHFFFANYWISSISAIAVFIINNSTYERDCGCDTNQKPQIDK
jgi:hypothetical protein